MININGKNNTNLSMQESYIVFSKEMDVETVQSLISEIESVENVYIKLYFGSPGGEISSMYVLNDYIKNSDKIFDIQVVDLAASAGLFILLLIKGYDNVSVTWGISSCGMAHTLDTGYSHRELLSKKSFSSFIKQQAKILDENLLSLVKDLLTENEIEDYTDGQDVYIDPTRLNKYFSCNVEEKILNFLSSEGTIINVDADLDELIGKDEEPTDAENEIKEKKETRVIVKQRGFEFVSNEHIVNKISSASLPTRGTKHSAGYDFVSPVAIKLEPNQQVKIYTDVKAYMLEDEVLNIYVRSSIGIKKGLSLSNGTGIIDSDYYSNKDNDGNIIICLRNNSTKTTTIATGEKFAQGIFTKFLKADNDDILTERTGGVGSTSENQTVGQGVSDAIKLTYSQLLMR
ncbi:MAG: ATP-dependent Clp protease proteolytic subunit [Fusobacteriaceae bacterium]